jgi:hypothetical protein
VSQKCRIFNMADHVERGLNLLFSVAELRFRLLLVADCNFWVSYIELFKFTGKWRKKRNLGGGYQFYSKKNSGP